MNISPKTLSTAWNWVAKNVTIMATGGRVDLLDKHAQDKPETFYTLYAGNQFSEKRDAREESDKANI